MQTCRMMRESGDRERVNCRTNVEENFRGSCLLIFFQIILFESDQFSPSHSLTRYEGHVGDAKHGRSARLSNLPTCLVVAPGKRIVGSTVEDEKGTPGHLSFHASRVLCEIGLLCAS
jgi:hypothetical protein